MSQSEEYYKVLAAINLTDLKWYENLGTIQISTDNPDIDVMIDDAEDGLGLFGYVTGARLSHEDDYDYEIPMRDSHDAIVTLADALMEVKRINAEFARMCAEEAEMWDELENSCPHSESEWTYNGGNPWYICIDCGVKTGDAE